MKVTSYLTLSLLLLLTACEFIPTSTPVIPAPTTQAPAVPAVPPPPVPAVPVVVTPQLPQPTASPTTVPDSTPAQPETLQTYTVRPRDNLYRIGLRYGVPWRRIAEANGIVNPRLLPIGKVLTIPPPLR